MEKKRKSKKLDSESCNSDQSINIITVNASMVADVIKQLSLNNSCGMDGISSACVSEY